MEVRLSLAAMATRFELLLHGDDSARLRAAGEEVLEEIERLDAQLSFYRPGSEIRWINALAAAGPVKVEPRLFSLLQHCVELSRATGGLFDITVGPLMRAWRFVNDTGAVPTPEDLRAARSVVGIDQIELDAGARTVRFRRRGVELDLGAYGKGYALERAREILVEAGVESALIHGGTSSVATIAAPPGAAAWRIRLQAPLADRGEPAFVDLAGGALSVSAVHGKSFTAAGRTYGHVLDPRAGEPVRNAAAAAVTGPSASICEVLSTALLVAGPSWLPSLTERFSDYRGIVT
jgi:thiamine biosynthesis lipoprotein